MVVQLLVHGTIQGVEHSGTTHTATNLVCGNTYTVSVTDKNNPNECVVTKTFECKANQTSSISPQHKISFPYEVNNVIVNNCNDDNDILINFGGDMNAFTYSWSNGSQSRNLQNVPSGTYTVTISSATYASYTQTFTVVGSSDIIIVGVEQNLSGPYQTDGAISLVWISGGQPGYTFQWSNGSTSQNITNLAQGAYTVTVTDNNNCSKTKTFSVGYYHFVIYASYAYPSCQWGSDGSISVNVTGGTPPYTYNWGNNNLPNAPFISNLSTGNYYLTITDANNQTISESYTVTAETNYTYVDNLGICHRVFTCHGEEYDVDMLDYNNPQYFFDEC